MIFVLVYYVYIQIKLHLIMRVQVRKSKGEKAENLIVMLQNLDTMLICRKALIQCCRIAKQFELELDLGNGQFSEQCDVDGSFFNSDAIIFWKSLTLLSSRLFSLTIGNDYFSIILLILGPIILRLFTD